MRDVNNGWLIRYMHSNTASAFFFLVNIVFLFRLSSLFLLFILMLSEVVYLKNLKYSSLESNTESLKKKKSLDSLSDENFYEWFRGYVDAEGCFFIQILENRFKLVFTFCVHKDELELIKYIAQRLGVGNISVGCKTISYTISSKNDLLKIFSIFDTRSLNTSKNLNYIVFRQAYDLYFNRESIKVSLELRKKMRDLKDQMNKNRIDFNQPKGHSIKITPYWLLGFVEGDGYFSVNLKTNSLKFGIGQTSQEIGVLEEIKKFLLLLPGNFKIKRKDSNLVKLEVYNQVKSRDHKSMAYITVNQTDYLINVLIPFFGNLIWLSKKEKDYKDWVIILNIIEQGKHFTEEGKNLIFLIGKRMNNYRLSTNLSNKTNECTTDLSIEERVLKLLDSPSNYEVQPDGKILIKSLGTNYRGRGNVGVKVLDDAGKLVYHFDSIKECALFFNVHSRTIIRRLDSGSFINFEGKLLVFKRYI